MASLVTPCHNPTMSSDFGHSSGGRWISLRTCIGVKLSSSHRERWHQGPERHRSLFCWLLQGQDYVSSQSEKAELDDIHISVGSSSIQLIVSGSIETLTQTLCTSRQRHKHVSAAMVELPAVTSLLSLRLSYFYNLVGVLLTMILWIIGRGMQVLLGAMKEEAVRCDEIDKEKWKNRESELMMHNGHKLGATSTLKVTHGSHLCLRNMTTVSVCVSKHLFVKCHSNARVLS
jgi:hypothetical protein